MINTADLIVIVHFLWVLFMVLGMPLGLWLQSPAFRWIHFGGMTATAFLAAAGWDCPLTVWEEALRRGADPGFSYGGSFLARHLSPILYPQIEPWILRSASVFWGALTILTMVMIKPEKRTGNSKE
jgi:hypothetical protein